VIIVFKKKLFIHASNQAGKQVLLLHSLQQTSLLIC